MTTQGGAAAQKQSDFEAKYAKRENSATDWRKGVIHLQKRDDGDEFTFLKGVTVFDAITNQNEADLQYLEYQHLQDHSNFRSGALVWYRTVLMFHLSDGGLHTDYEVQMRETEQEAPSALVPQQPIDHLPVVIYSVPASIGKDWKGWNQNINAMFKNGRLPDELVRGLGDPKSGVAINWCPYTMDVVIRGHVADPTAVEQFFSKINDEGFLDWMIDGSGTQWSGNT
jgi:hypothetical protein